MTGLIDFGDEDFPLTIDSREQLESALRLFISGIDYDIHKGYESDEETGEDTYWEVTEDFLVALGQVEGNVDD